MSAFGEIWHQLKSSGWIVLASFVIGYLAWSARVAWRENKKLCPRCDCSLAGITTVEVRHGGGKGASRYADYCESCAATIEERRHIVEYVVYAVFGVFALAITPLIDAPQILTIPVTLAVLWLCWRMVRS